MSHESRLHPEDLEKLIGDVSKNLTEKLEELLSRNNNVSEMQTFTSNEVAKILNRNPTTILRYLDKGLIKATKPGKDWIITQESLTNYIDGK